MVRPSTKGLYKGELCCRLLQTKLQVLNRKGPLLRNSHTGSAPLLHVCPSKGRFPEPLKNLAWNPWKSEKAWRGGQIWVLWKYALLLAVSMWAASIWCTKCQVVLCTFALMRGFNAKSSYTHLVLVNSKARVPSYLGSSILQVCYFHKKGTAPNTCAYVRFLEPSSAKRACQRLQYPRPRPCLAGCATHGMTWNVMHTTIIPNLCKCANTWILCLLIGSLAAWNIGRGPPPCVVLYQKSPILWRNRHLHPLHLW